MMTFLQHFSSNQIARTDGDALASATKKNMTQPIQCAVAKMMNMNLHPAIHRTSALRSSCLCEKYFNNRVTRITRMNSHNATTFTGSPRMKASNCGMLHSSSKGICPYITARTLHAVTS